VDGAIRHRPADRIGIGEVCGRLPTSYVGPRRQSATWSAGIGQGPVAATPLQMCNVAATIARRGIWIRPNLAMPGQKVAPFKPKKIPAGDHSWDDIPSRLDLQIDQAAIDAAIDGMKRVVNSEAGTGTVARRPDMIVAGKTGTVQASPMLVPVEEDGETKLVRLTPSTHEQPDRDHPWYRASDETGEKLNHAWFIGFVPADQPRYAISVMVEYGGGGGGAVAGPIAQQIIEALVEHGYLHKGK
jgi:cell division protein FtsI/penicillin-binding protein 2